MIAFTILSAIAGGVCGILDGHTREVKPRQPRYDSGGLVHKGEAISPPSSRRKGKVIGRGNPVTHNFPIGEVVEVNKTDRISHYCMAKGGLEQWVGLADLELI